MDNNKVESFLDTV